MTAPASPLSAASGRAAASRAALIAAARRLHAEGRTPSVTEAARAAGLSRATAYRQFPSPELLAEAAATDPEGAPIPDILAGLTRPRDRALAVCDWRLALAVRAPEATRRHLALRQQARLRDAAASAPCPSPRAEAAFRAALVPILHRLPADHTEDLIRALLALTGPEAMVAAFDRGVSPELAARAARRALVALVDAAAAAARPSRPVAPPAADPARPQRTGPRAVPGARPPISAEAAPVSPAA
ncbi:MAG: hypothetical protein VYD87_09100 [Pseudomonadota bacterium]|nr:hypothetical protein [Pseudomonadota bacterium]